MAIAARDGDRFSSVDHCNAWSTGASRKDTTSQGRNEPQRKYDSFQSGDADQLPSVGQCRLRPLSSTNHCDRSWPMPGAQAGEFIATLLTFKTTS